MHEGTRTCPPQKILCYNFLQPTSHRNRMVKINMSSAKNKLRLVGAFIALATLALAASCTGFFVNPTLTTITINPPDPNISQNSSQQMTATGTLQDGTTSTLTGGTSCSGNT